MVPHDAHETALTPSDSVRIVQNQDGAVLLDIRQGICLSMTPVGAKIWNLLQPNSSVDQITDSLAAEFSVPRQQVCEDVSAFIGDLTQKGLLLSAKPTGTQEHLGRTVSLILGGHRMLQRWAPRNGKGVRFLFWKALIALLAFDLLQFSKSFPRMHEFIQSWTTAPSTPPPDAVDRVCRAINYACVWYPKRIRCLQRSAVITCLLRSCGVSAQMVIGAQKLPFKAHAWAEVDSRAINERRDVQNIYLVWERC
jgi:hypothetical protein